MLLKKIVKKKKEKENVTVIITDFTLSDII